MFRFFSSLGGEGSGGKEDREKQAGAWAVAFGGMREGTRIADVRARRYSEVKTKIKLTIRGEKAEFRKVG